MRVMIVNGAPRKGGYTSDMTALFKKGAESEGAQVEELFLRNAKINTCVGCFSCWAGESVGNCVFVDDMSDIIERYLNVDVLVLASPMYFYTFSSLTKIFIERLFSTSKPGIDKEGIFGMGRNRPRFSGRGPQKCVLIATCALHNPKAMSAMNATFDLICDALAVESAGVLFRPDSCLLDFTQAKPKTIHLITTAFVNAGIELVRHGRISDETQQQAATLFLENEEVFGSHFANYWKIASEMGPEWKDRKALALKVNEDPRIIIKELAGYLDPKVAKDRILNIQFVLLDSPNGNWVLHVEDGVCKAQEGVHPSPNLKLTMNYRTFADISLQKTPTRSAVQRGLIEIDGDKRLFAEFSRLFPRQLR